MYKWARFVLASRNRVFYRTLLCLFTIPICRAVLVNRTIDSNKGDPATGFVPIYQPQNESPWADQTCSGCFIQPDITKAYDGTWKAATYHPQLLDVNITLRFTGVAIWVFFILANANSHGTDVDAPASQSASLSTTATFSSTTDSSPTSSTSSPTSTPQTSSKIGVIVGCTLGVLVVIALVLVFLVRRSRRPLPVRHEKVEGALNIDAPPHQSPHGEPHRHDPSAPSASEYTRFPPSSSSAIVRNHAPERSTAAILGEARQMEIDKRIQSAQREMDSVKSVRNARSAGEIGSPSAPDQPRRMEKLASLRNELQQLRDQIGNLQAQREPDLAPGLSNEPLPPVYEY
ncbi:hypothetical protein M378DRAFT_163687 [Amanita muscaria Koide BX008]|uniref:Uncharacterized protein n=1 Tax=Amanita muscaria (strain Koide BX008) TaxID=946122 RepID=A0A0C2TB99_AMAMK|nr:hypothetical protein M378DRAFT_163687 [Amanita muscaria Koide BX008]